jgi:hypothetical protein
MNHKRNFEGLKDSQIRVGARFAWLGVGDPYFSERQPIYVSYVLNSAFGGMLFEKSFSPRGSVLLGRGAKKTNLILTKN